MQTESVRVETKPLEKAREYCTKNGIKLTWFVSRAIEKELNINRPPRVDGRYTKAQLTIDGD